MFTVRTKHLMEVTALRIVFSMDVTCVRRRRLTDHVDCKGKTKNDEFHA